MVALQEFKVKMSDVSGAVRSSPPDRNTLIYTSNEPFKIGKALYKDASVVRFEGGVYVISHKTEFTVNTTHICNAACGFCSNGVTFMPSASPYLSIDDNFKKSLGLAQLAQVRKASISGGEPTSNPLKLVDTHRLVKFMIPRTKLHTNGFRLLEEIEVDGKENKPLLDVLIDDGLNGVSLSVAHHNPVNNAKIMKFSGRYKGLTDEVIRQIASRKSDTFNPRLSCVLTEGGVWTAEDIAGYIKWGIDLGISTFILRADFSIPSEFNRSLNAFRKPRTSELAKLLLHTSINKEPVKQEWELHKSDIDAYELSVGGATILLDAGAEELDIDQKIRRLIVFPTAEGKTVTHTNWLNPWSVLFEDESSIQEADRLAQLQVPHLMSKKVELYEQSRKKIFL